MVYDPSLVNVDNVDALVKKGQQDQQQEDAKQAELNSALTAEETEAVEPVEPKKVPLEESDVYKNALNGIEPTEADLAPFSFMERAKIGNTWITNSRKGKDPSQFGITENTKEFFEAVKGGTAKTYSSIISFPERVVDMATGAYEREVKEKGTYTPGFDPLSLSEYDPEMKTWWGPYLANGVHFYGLGRLVTKTPGVKGLLPKAGVPRDVVAGAIGSGLSSTSQESSMTQQLYESGIAKKVPWVGDILQEQVIGRLPTRTMPEDHPMMKTFKNVLEGMGFDAVIGRILSRFDTAVENRGTRLEQARRENIAKQKFEAAKAETEAAEARLPQKQAELAEADEALIALETQAKGMPDGPEKDRAVMELEQLRGDLQVERERINKGQFSAYSNPELADSWQGAPNSQAKSISDQAAQTKRMHEAYPIDGANSTDSMFTPVQANRMATEAGMLESELKSLARKLVTADEFEAMANSARALGKSFKEAYGYSFERIQEVLGRDKTAVDAEDFWKPFFDEAVQYPDGAKAWLMENVVMADMVNASLFTQIRDLGIASKELIEIADLKDVDGPFKTIYDRLIVGLTNTKRARWLWSDQGKTLRDGLLSNQASSKQRLAEITEAYRAESEAVVSMVMEVAENAKDMDTVLALVDIFSKNNKVQNWMDFDAFWRAKLKSGGLTQQPGYLIRELQSMQTNSMLSSVKTPQRAISGTFTSGLLRQTMTAVGGRALRDQDTARANAAALNAYLQTIPEAWSVFKNNLGSYWAGDVKTIKNRFAETTRVSDADWNAMRAAVETRGTIGDKTAFGLANWARILNDPRKILGRIASGMSSALNAGDDAFRVIVARARARERAMRKAMDESKVGNFTEVNDDLVRKYEDEFYKEYLDKDGNLNFDSDAYLQSTFEEATLTKDLDNWGKALENLMNSNPVTAPFFKFARTGVNGMAVSYKSTPLLGKLHKESIDIIRATPNNLDSVRKYGIHNAEDLANAKALQAGREAVGGTIVTMGSMAYLNGCLTGDGPLDPTKRKIWEDTGWQPRSFCVPGVGWVSYESFEPFNNVLAGIANTGDNIKQMGPEWGAKNLGEIALVVGQAATTKRYLQGLSQFTDIFSGDLSKLQRVGASLANNTVPLAGIRRDMGMLFNPYMREINNSWHETLRNRNLSSELIAGEPLPVKTDVLNGKKIRDWNLLERAYNATSAFPMRLEHSPGRTLLHNSNYDLPLAITRSFDGLDLSDYPQFRSWFQEEMGKYRRNGKSLEDELNELATRPEVQDSVKLMMSDILRWDRTKDPMKAYLHNRLIKDRMDTWRDKAWANVRKKHPEVEILYKKQQELDINTARTYAETMKFLKESPK